jgi:hypothetical protein
MPVLLNSVHTFFTRAKFSRRLATCTNNKLAECGISMSNCCLEFPEAAIDLGIYSASNRNEYQRQIKIFLESRMRSVRNADNLTAICEPIVLTMRDNFHLTNL